jgi:hypothetical protein
MDSDLTNDPAFIPQFAAKLSEGRWDLVKASRYVPNGGMRGVPARRRAVTIAGNAVARTLFGMGIRDCTNGFRAVRLELISDVTFKETGFPIILEELLILKKRGARATSNSARPREMARYPARRKCAATVLPSIPFAPRMRTVAISGPRAAGPRPP